MLRRPRPKRAAVTDLASAAHTGPNLPGGRRRGNDNYVKAASEEREKLLNTKLKSICRGC